MLSKRVVVTGMAGISPIGQGWTQVKQSLVNRTSGIRYMDDWNKYEGLETRLGAPVRDFVNPKDYSRKQTRSMGRVALMATRATELALIDADLLNSSLLKSGSMGVSYGSSAGTPDAVGDFSNMLSCNSTRGINAMSYLKMMSHTTPVNIGVFFGLKGRIITTSSACTSGSQGIGYGYEAIKHGHQLAMVCGGAEELCATQAAVFDTLFATTTKNSTPELTPRPFDKDRDGLVIGEGACTLILEELEHALNRGATIHAEIIGFGTNSDGQHITQPNPDRMRAAMELSLVDAQIDADKIGYVSAHGTATDRGDIAESNATAQAIGKHTPFSALKSYTGHTLGACGALEAWTTVCMMNDHWFHPIINFDQRDPQCAELDYIVGEGREMECETAMSNNFAFGGINTSLIFRKFSSSSL